MKKYNLLGTDLEGIEFTDLTVVEVNPDYTFHDETQTVTIDVILQNDMAKKIGVQFKNIPLGPGDNNTIDIVNIINSKLALLEVKD
ncbi:MAG: hypothetical protein KAS32_00050 [Candidatus Peribacteraceae bacterium]|nr:hypothetical protein [Candidatus Peribacteraceae bacterium]